MLHRSSKPMQDWFLAMFLFATNKQGVSALWLQNHLGFGSYNTAMRWVRVLHEVMGAVPTSLLGPVVEADETHTGGVKEGKGSGPRKPRVAGIVEVLPNGCGRIRLKHVKSKSETVLCSFVEANVAKRSLVKTDGLPSYNKLAKMGYYHDPRVVKQDNKMKKLANGRYTYLIHLPMVHLVFDKFKRMVLCTHQGVVSDRHLQEYLDAFAFRFNLKNLEVATHKFVHLVDQALKKQCKPYWEHCGRRERRKSTYPKNTTAQRYGLQLQEMSYGG